MLLLDDGGAGDKFLAAAFLAATTRPNTPSGPAATPPAPTAQASVWQQLVGAVLEAAVDVLAHHPPLGPMSVQEGGSDNRAQQQQQQQQGSGEQPAGQPADVTLALKCVW